MLRAWAAGFVPGAADGPLAGGSSYRLTRAAPVARGQRRIELGPAWLDARLSLRLATDADREPLFAWHRDAFHDHIEQIWGWDADWQRNDFSKLVEHVPTFVVVLDNLAVGYLQLLTRRDALHLVNLALTESVRGQRIGSQLLVWLKQRALAAGLALTLGVFVTNPRARAFYERHGFELSETTLTHWRMRWPVATPGGGPAPKACQHE